MLHAALECHPAAPCAPLRGIRVSLNRAADGRLEVRYVLEGEIDRLRVPQRSKMPRGAERLWQHTCCEMFVAREGQPGYDEYNFSPSGDWAAYSFAAYREGSVRAIPDPGIAVTRDASRLQLEARVMPRYAEKLRIGLSVVAEDARGTLSYWALRHPPGKPDFHHPAAFVLELDEVRH